MYSGVHIAKPPPIRHPRSLVSNASRAQNEKRMPMCTRGISYTRSHFTIPSQPQRTKWKRMLSLAHVSRLCDVCMPCAVG